MATVTAIEYSGLIWCPTVSTGAFVARRSGKVFITGNSGFPKSLNVANAIHDAAIGQPQGGAKPSSKNHGKFKSGCSSENETGRGFGAGPGQFMVEAGGKAERDLVTEAITWQGWGTALKPALEPITVARKPLVGTVAANVLEHGTGALNIDASRIPTHDKLGGGAEKAQNAGQIHEGWQRPWMNDLAAAEAYAERIRANVARSEELGRWPANLIHDGSDEVLALFPVTPPAKSSFRGIQQRHDVSSPHTSRPKPGTNSQRGHDDNGGSAARFFYCAKASKRDRDEGLEGFEPAKTNDGRKVDADNAYPARRDLGANIHPTVKPTDLMRYLCRLVTPPGGVVLDPFMGSGSTGKAAMREGFRFIGCEMSPEYLAIAEARISHELAMVEAERASAAAAVNPQFDMFAQE